MNRGKSKVKNRAPAAIQITAEQILREAGDRGGGVESATPTQKITTPEELHNFRTEKRKEFEDRIRTHGMNIGNWLKYAKWEVSQKEYDRARSIFERILELEYDNAVVWLRYAEMEIKIKCINHARNIFDRAVALLPRVDKVWYRYVFIEESVGNIAGCRNVFDRWMRWEPDEQAWLSYVKFEIRAKETEKVRGVYERYVVCIPTSSSYIRYAKWEARSQQQQLARKVFERAFEELPDHEIDPELYVQFAKFEEICGEIERCRAIFKFALEKIPKAQAESIREAFVSFEKQHGSSERIDDVITHKRRLQYEEKLRASPMDYDIWFDLIRLEEAAGDVGRIRETYERAIANVPPVAEKKYWRRYIYLWINYALFEELTTKDVARTREVYKACAGVVPHKKFTFAKIWTLWAHFEVRQKRLTAARKIFGQGIGRCPKDRTYKEYIQLELNLGNFDRCRTLYQKYLEFAPHNCLTWIKFAELEATLNEFERTRALYELGVSQEILDKPELLWKSYIDFEISQKEWDRTRTLYERLLERTSHVKVFISFAQFEISLKRHDVARVLYKRAYDKKREDDLSEDCVLILDDWLRFEESLGTKNASNADKVRKMLPKKVTKKRMVKLEDGTDAGWEEYYDYIFPDDKSAANGLKMLELAKKWKASMAAKQREAAPASPPSEEPEGDEDATDEIDLGDL